MLNVWIMSFQQAVECCNWCWKFNLCFHLSFQLLSKLDPNSHKNLENSLKEPQNAKLRSELKNNNNKNHLLFYPNFNIRRPVEMTWCTHNSHNQLCVYLQTFICFPKKNKIIENILWKCRQCNLIMTLTKMWMSTATTAKAKAHWARK